MKKIIHQKTKKYVKGLNHKKGPIQDKRWKSWALKNNLNFKNRELHSAIQLNKW